MLDAGDEHAGVADDEAAGLDEDAQVQRLEQRDEVRGVGGGREDVLRGRGLPPSGVAAGKRVLVNDAEAAADAEELELVFGLQLGDEGEQLVHRRLEGFHAGELGADVGLDAAQAEVLQLRGTGIDTLDLLEGDAELVLVGAGGDLGVGAGVHVRVHAHGDGGDLLEARGDLVDALQLGLGFAVEAVNAGLEGELDLGLGLADAGEDALGGVAAGGDDAAQLAFADGVEAAAGVGEHAHDGLVGVGLHRVADEVVERGEGVVELVEVVLEGGLRIDVEGRAVLLHERRDGDAFTTELFADVANRMHGGALCPPPGEVQSAKCRGRGVWDTADGLFNRSAGE